MQKINPYPSINTLEINSKRDWSEGDNYKWYVEEKIDGSQLSIIIDDNDKLTFYNKKSIAGSNNQAFEKSTTMLRFKYENKGILNPNYIYHGESVCRIKHNVCVYERTPKSYFILYDIYDNISATYLSLEIKVEEAKRVGFELVQILYQNDNVNQTPNQICNELISKIENEELKSCLGGTIEGVVLKHHSYVKNGKTSATKLKLVTDKFKERHFVKQPKAELSLDDFLQTLGKSFATEARFHKAIQHLSENGQININLIKNSDQGKIIGELDSDFDKEYRDELKELLYLEFSPLLKKLARDGLNKWFKDNYPETI